MTVSKDGPETFTHRHRNTDVYRQLTLGHISRKACVVQEASGNAEWRGVNDMHEEKAGDDAGAPRRVERHEASVGMRKGSNGRLMWSL